MTHDPRQVADLPTTNQPARRVFRAVVAFTRLRPCLAPSGAALSGHGAFPGRFLTVGHPSRPGRRQKYFCCIACVLYCIVLLYRIDTEIRYVNTI